VEDETAVEPKAGTVPAEIQVSDTSPVSFGTITYKLADLGEAASKTFYYTITEEIPSDAKSNENIDPGSGIKYDGTVHRLKVTVSDNGTGVLQKEIELDGVLVAEASVEVEFINEQLTDFTFYKVWHDVESHKVPWGDVESLTVTVGRKLSGGDEDSSFSYTYTVLRNAFTESGTDITASDSSAEAPKLKAILVPAKEEGGVPQYKFYMENLEKANASGTDYIYLVRETQVPGYLEPNYGNSQENGFAVNNGEIINKPYNSVELPYTGGPGTGIFTFLGILLIATAGVLLLRRKRNEVRNL
jgi:LPXTG-motif cell wall-anchored protein